MILGTISVFFLKIVPVAKSGRHLKIFWAKNIKNKQQEVEATKKSIAI
jgi:hypothetical protein